MGAVNLPDSLRRLIGRQVAEGRAASEAEFLAQAVQRYADALEADDEEILSAADQGIADIEAGRFELISGPDDLQRLRTQLTLPLLFHDKSAVFPVDALDIGRRIFTKRSR